MQTGLLYSAEGARFSEKVNTSNFVNTAQLNYLRIPIEVLYNFKPKNNIAPYFSAGVSIGKLIGGNMNTKEGATLTSTIQSRDIYKHTDAGLQVGIGIKTKQLSVGVSIYHGLVNLYKEPAPITQPIKNVHAALAVGYNLGRRSK